MTSRLLRQPVEGEWVQVGEEVEAEQEQARWKGLLHLLQHQETKEEFE